MHVYLTINILTGKKYVGQTAKDNNQYIGSGKVIKQAIKKYGRDVFVKLILKTCNSKEELDFYEKKYIKDYDAVRRGDYYNLAQGGAGSNGNLGRKGVLNPLYKRLKSEAFKKNLSIKRKGVKMGPMSQETKDKISKANKGNSHHLLATEAALKVICKKVAQIDKEGNVLNIFNSIKEAAEHMNGNVGFISRCCSGAKRFYKRKGMRISHYTHSYKGYKWRYYNGN